MPVIPRSFLCIVLLWLSQPLSDITHPSDLTGSLLRIPNNDHVCLILDVLWVCQHIGEGLDGRVDCVILWHVQWVIKEDVQVVQMDGCELLPVLATGWPLCFYVDSPGQPFAPVHIDGLAAINLWPHVGQYILNRHPVLSSIHTYEQHLSFFVFGWQCCICFGQNVATLHYFAKGIGHVVAAVLLKRGCVVAALLSAFIAAAFSLHSQKQLLSSCNETTCQRAHTCIAC